MAPKLAGYVQTCFSSLETASPPYAAIFDLGMAVLEHCYDLNLHQTYTSRSLLELVFRHKMLFQSPCLVAFNGNLPEDGGTS